MIIDYTLKKPNNVYLLFVGRDCWGISASRGGIGCDTYNQRFKIFEDMGPLSNN